LQFRYRGSRRESAVAQLFSLGSIRTPMKKIIIIGFVVALVVASVLLWQHSKHPSDAKLARQITGAWTKDTSKMKAFSLTDPLIYTRTFSTDGSYSFIWGHQSALVTFLGTWLVKDGELVVTFTSSHGTGSHQAASVAGQVDHCKIVHVDEHQLIYMEGGNTNILTR
jgi:hypothetical protein